MTRMYLHTAIFASCRRTAIGAVLMAGLISTGCTTNYLTNSTEGTYGVPITERTIAQRLLDRSIEHTAKINVYGLRENLQQISRISIDSFHSEVLLTGEVPTEAIKAEVAKVITSMPDVRRVYNELDVSASKGYSSTVHDSYITSKLLAKIATNDGIKVSQIKAVTNSGRVYIMGRTTPMQQSHLIDAVNSTVGITELVLLTTVVDDRGINVNADDIMYENNLANPAAVAVADRAIESNIDNTNQPSSSPYINLYRNQ